MQALEVRRRECMQQIDQHQKVMQERLYLEKHILEKRAQLQDLAYKVQERMSEKITCNSGCTRTIAL
jgi:hypothetical protein